MVWWLYTHPTPRRTRVHMVLLPNLNKKAGSCLCFSCSLQTCGHKEVEILFTLG